MSFLLTFRIARETLILMIIGVGAGLCNKISAMADENA
jgi:hypothetical protein